MSDIAQIVGDRLRAKRREMGYSQEKVAELAGLHPTYIGQLERGEKNATLESIEKICLALDYPMSQLFENIVAKKKSENIANQCYSLIINQTVNDQEALLKIIKDIINYKQNSNYRI
ncbi:MAG: helix-turn-helix transcriptional regulator [Lachnospiraceae bacterium]|nr:helix-turn-helix transcriptional regulator [Lachnospiraceae bacterium]